MLGVTVKIYAILRQMRERRRAGGLGIGLEGAGRGGCAIQ